ncbi:MAG: hypothetical protein CMF31_05170 [Kordiimonas sp.]|nr:hypothetical protein [Kordiimonas sp.]|tara:strand:+ start:699 stop:980 length:282 start_codon:yes stop_codon:yes gene_type:complete
MEIEDILNEREKTHGDFATQAMLSQRLKRVLLLGCERRADWEPEQLESLEMIVHKIARILAGNPDEPDHWCDIAGYATLVARSLENRPDQEDI